MRAADRAATKIQAGFRGYRVRKQMRLAAQVKDRNGPRSRMSGGARNGEGLAGQQPPAETDKERSATKIQAGVRGFLVRRRRQAEHRAAATIQAGFRAFKARRQTRPSRTGPQAEDAAQ